MLLNKSKVRRRAKNWPHPYVNGNPDCNGHICSGIHHSWGYKAADPHKGMVVLGRNVAFRTFIITDTIAMTSSMMAALILIIMPLQTDEEIIKRFHNYSLGLLWLALMAMGIAFVTGLYAVLSEQLPLAIVVCCIGCILPLIIYGGASVMWPFN
ncbi:hypothetical protein AAG906_011713 [Vitis piasezkii]